MKMHKLHSGYRVGFAGVILLLFLLKFPSFIAPLYFIDEGIYAAIAHFMSNGYVLYRSVFDNKTPSIYYLFLVSRHFFSYNILPLKIFVASCSLGTLLLEYKVIAKWFTTYRRYFIVLCLFAFVLLNGIEDNLVNAEVIFAFFSIASIALLSSFNEEKSIIRYIIAGLLMGVGITFKATAAFDMVAFILTYAIFSITDVLVTKNRERFLQDIFHIILYTVSAALPLLLYILYFAYTGALQGFIQSAFLSSGKYVSIYNNVYVGISTSTINVVILILCLAGILGWYIHDKNKGKIEHKAITFISIWGLCALYATLISGRPYTHYLLQIAVPISILIGLLIYTRKAVYMIIAGVIFCLFIMYFYRNSQNQIPFQNISQYTLSPIYSYAKEYGYYLGLVSKKTYENNFLINEGSLDASNLQTLISYSKNLPKRQNGNIFIWGNIPWVYATTNLHPVCGYSFNYYIDQSDVDKLGYIMKCLQANPPAYIIDDVSRYNFTDLYEFEKEHYTLKDTFFEGFTKVYVLK